LGLAPAVLFLMGFFVVPLLGNVWDSVHPADVFDLSGYRKLVTDPFYLGVIGQTIGLSLLVTVVSLVVGYPVAYFLAHHAGRWRGLVMFGLVAPLLTSIIMRTFGWRVLFARRGLVNSVLMDLGLIGRPADLSTGLTIVVVALVHVLVPYMVLSLAAVLKGIDPRTEEAARIHGANTWNTFWLITVPLSLDGIATGSILVFMLAAGSFVTVLLLGGGVQTLPLLIFQQFSTTRDFPLASAMSNVLLVLALACLFLQLRLIRRAGVQ